MARLGSGIVSNKRMQLLFYIKSSITGRPYAIIIMLPAATLQKELCAMENTPNEIAVENAAAVELFAHLSEAAQEALISAIKDLLSSQQ